MDIALGSAWHGGVGWTPDVFWSATPRELWAAIDMNSGKTKDREEQASFATFRAGVEDGIRRRGEST